MAGLFRKLIDLTGVSQHVPQKSRFMSSNLGSLCSKCQEIFHPSAEVCANEYNIIMFPLLDLSFKPETCCFCAVICERHERFIEQTTKCGHDVELLSVTVGVAPYLHPSGDRIPAISIKWNYTKDQRNSQIISVVPEQGMRKSYTLVLSISRLI